MRPVPHVGFWETILVLPNRWTAIFLSTAVILSALSVNVRATQALDQFVKAAATRNPGMELVTAERNMAQKLTAKSEQLFADPPTANLKYLNDALTSDLGYREWEGGIEMPLWLPGQAQSYSNEADRSLAASDTMSSVFMLKISGEVRSRLWAAAIARAESKQAQAAVSASRELLENVNKRVNAGELPQSNRLLAQNDLLFREEAFQVSEKKARQTAQLFYRYTGFELPDELTPETIHEPVALRPEHPRLQLAQNLVSRAEAYAERISETSHVGPSLWLGAKSVKEASNIDYETALGIEISLPFAEGAHHAPEIAAAETALTQVKMAQREIRIELQEALSTAQIELEGAENAAKYSKSRMSVANESLALNQRAFELGETDLFRLLEYQADALSAQNDYRIRQLELGEAAAKLNQALGVIPQ